MHLPLLTRVGCTRYDVHGCAARRVLGSCSKRAHHPRASPVAAEGEAGPAPEAGCRSSRRRRNLKPYAHNISPCRTAICASAPMPRRAHVPPAEAHLRPLPPASPIPCAEAGRSMSRPHRPRRRRILCRVPSRSPAPFVVRFCCCDSHAFLCCGAPPCRLL